MSVGCRPWVLLRWHFEMGNHATSSDAGLQPPIRLPPCRRPAEAKARPAVCDTSGQPLRPSCFATHLTSGQGTRRPSTSSPLAGNLEQILCAPWSRPRQGLARPARKRPRYTQIQRCKIPRQPLHVHDRVMASLRGQWSGLARLAVRRATPPRPRPFSRRRGAWAEGGQS